MPHEPQDPRWPRLLGLAVHEFRTPLSVVGGYIRMLLKERAGAVTDQQRKLLEEAEKSCGRLSALLSEMSDLASLEAHTTTFNRSSLALGPALTAVVAGLPPLPDREVTVSLQLSDADVRVDGDAVRLKTAFTSILVALRRELVRSANLPVRQLDGELDGHRASWIAIGDSTQDLNTRPADTARLTTFDEWRGGTGLSLAIARRVINAHGGSIWSAADGTQPAAVIALPVL